MKIKPVVTDHIQTKHTSFEVNLHLDSNVTFISGDSGTGKSALYSFMEEYAAENKSIKCFNYLDLKKSYKSSIKQSKGKLFIIDNADILLDDNMRSYCVCRFARAICTDSESHFHGVENHNKNEPA